MANIIPLDNWSLTQTSRQDRRYSLNIQTTSTDYADNTYAVPVMSDLAYISDDNGAIQVTADSADMVRNDTARWQLVTSGSEIRPIISFLQVKSTDGSATGISFTSRVRV